MKQSDRPSEDLSISQPFEHVLFDEPNEAPEGGNWRLELVNLAGVPRLVESQSSRAGDGPRTSSRSPALTFVWPPPAMPFIGRLQVRMADRTEAESAPGEITRPPGHDAWWSAMSQCCYRLAGSVYLGQAARRELARRCVQRRVSILK
jgi:hypothetical protein